MVNENLLALFPILLSAIVCLVKRGEKRKPNVPAAMTLGAGAASILFLLRQGFDLAAFQSLWEKLKGIFIQNDLSLVEGFFHGKSGILFSLFLLSVLSELLLKSGIIDQLNAWRMRTNASLNKVLSVFLGAIFLTSPDDYLSIILLSEASGETADEFGIPKIRSGIWLHLLIISICCLAPWSSWGAAICGELRNFDAVSFSLWSLAAMNFIPILRLIYVAVDATEEAKSAQSHAQPVLADIQADKQSALEWKGSLKALLIPFLMLIGVFFLLDYLGQGIYALPLSSLLSVLSLLWLKPELRREDSLIQVLQKALNAAFETAQLLVPLWVLIDISLASGLREIIEQLSHLPGNFLSAGLIPAMVFLFASLFTFITGSSFSGFAIFMPLAVAASSSDPLLLQLSVAAALSGSLSATNSFFSETLHMIAKRLGVLETTLFKKQLPIGMTIQMGGLISYLCAGLLMDKLRAPLAALTIGLVVGASFMFLIRKRILKAEPVAPRAEFDDVIVISLTDMIQS